MTAIGNGWIELAITAASADLDAIADLLGDFAPGAVWMESAIETSDHRDFAYTVLATGTVHAVVPEWSAGARAALTERLATLPFETAPGPLLERAVGVHDWAEEWKRFYHVLHVGRRLVVRPSWEDYTAAEGEVVVTLDPGTAFGTGQHVTTRLCLAALEREVRPGTRVLDVGCGSGILSVAAAALGARQVVAVDVEPDAVRATSENAATNHLERSVRAGLGSVGPAWPWPAEPSTGAFDLVVANISAAVLGALLPEASAALVPGGVFVGAGFIAEASAAVLAAAREAGLSMTRLDTLEDDGGTEWHCLIATRSTAPSR